MTTRDNGGLDCANSQDLQDLSPDSSAEELTSLPQDRSVFNDFINAIDEDHNNNEGYFYFRAIKPANGASAQTQEVKGRPWTDGVFNKLCALNNDGYGIYMIINQGEGYETNNISEVRSLFLDWDNDDEMNSGVKSDWPVEPSMVVQTSQYKYQYYWLLDPFKVGENVAQWFKDRSQSMLSQHSGFDRSITNVNRLMRVPGFINTKDGAGNVVKMLKSPELGDYYDPIKIEAQYPTLERAVKVRDGESTDTRSMDELNRAIDAVKSISIQSFEGSSRELRMNSVMMPFHQVFSLADDEIHEKAVEFLIEWNADDAWTERSDFGNHWDESRVIDEYNRISDTGSNVATLGSMYALAKKSGWVDPRSAPDFGEIPIETKNASEEKIEPPKFPDIINAFDLLDKPMPPVKWVIPKLIMAKQYGVLHGASGLGKSYLLLQMLLEASKPNAEVFGNPDWAVEDGVKTLYVSFEDYANQIQGRLKDIQGFDDKPEHWENFNVLPIADSHHSHKLMRGGKIDENTKRGIIEAVLKFGSDIVVLDTLRSSFDGDEDNPVFAELVSHIREICKQTGASVLVVHHDRKGNRDNPDIESARGGSTVIDPARFVLGLANNENAKAGQSGIMLTVEKLTEGRAGDQHFFDRLDPNSGVLTFNPDGVRNKQEGRARVSEEEVKTAVKEYVANNWSRYLESTDEPPLTKKSITLAVAESGMPRDRTMKAIDHLFKTGLLVSPNESEVEESKARFKESGAHWNGRWSESIIHYNGAKLESY